MERIPSIPRLLVMESVRLIEVKDIKIARWIYKDGKSKPDKRCKGILTPKKSAKRKNELFNSKSSFSRSMGS